MLISRYLKLRPGEKIFDRIEPIEDTKGNSGVKGRMVVTSLRIIWHSLASPRINMCKYQKHSRSGLLDELQTPEIAWLQELMEATMEILLFTLSQKNFSYFLLHWRVKELTHAVISGHPRPRTSQHECRHQSWDSKYVSINCANHNFYGFHLFSIMFYCPSRPTSIRLT